MEDSRKILSLSYVSATSYAKDKQDKQALQNINDLDSELPQ